MVGSGIAGLSCSWLLSQEHDVTIFEREVKLGMDAHAVINPDGTHFDVPLRIFNPKYYPNLTKLYETVGIRYQPVDFAFSCTYMLPSEGGALETLQGDAKVGTGLSFFRYSNSTSIVKLSYPSLSLDPMQKWIPGWAHAVKKYGKLCFSLLHFFLFSPGHLRDGRLEGKSLGQYLRSEGYSQVFIGELLYPMLTVVCTCSYETLDKYPAEVIVAYFSSQGFWSWFPNPKRASAHLSGSHCRVTDGVCDVVAKLSGDCSNIHLNSKVSRVCPRRGGSGSSDGSNRASVEWLDGATGEHRLEHFDDVVIATQAHHAKKLVSAGGGNPKMIGALSCWDYETSRVVVHTDAKLMPARKADWSNVNLVLESQNAKCFEGNETVKNLPFHGNDHHANSSSASSRRAEQDCPGKLAASMCSIWMHPIDNTLDKGLIQTWNPIIEPDKNKVIVNSWFERPTLNSKTVKGIDTLRECQGDGGLYFVGAYSLYSMPLLENGVRSSCKVATMLGVPPKWGDICYQGDEFLQNRKEARQRITAEGSTSALGSSMKLLGWTAFLAGGVGVVMVTMFGKERRMHAMIS